MLVVILRKGQGRSPFSSLCWFSRRTHQFAHASFVPLVSKVVEDGLRSLLLPCLGKCLICETRFLAQKSKIGALPGHDEMLSWLPWLPWLLEDPLGNCRDPPRLNAPLSIFEKCDGVVQWLETERITEHIGTNNGNLSRLMGLQDGTLHSHSVPFPGFPGIRGSQSPNPTCFSPNIVQAVCPAHHVKRLSNYMFLSPFGSPKPTTLPLLAPLLISNPYISS